MPVYLQLVQQVKQAIRMGVLHADDQLPTVKEVVAQIAINPNTVAKAYRELEYEHIVEGRPGLGTFVVGGPKGAPPDVYLKLSKTLSTWIARARESGLSDEDIEALVQSTLRKQAERDSA